MQNTAKRLSVLAGIVALVLMVPAIAMRLTNEVDWSFFDFVFMGVLLFGAGLVYELVGRKMNNKIYRAAVGLTVVTSVLLVWVNGAVGIIGDGPINSLYFGVFATGLLGVLFARFRPQGMSHALFAMALVQALVPVIALMTWGSQISWTPSILGVFVLNAFFVLLFAGAGLLFRYAGSEA